MLVYDNTKIINKPSNPLPQLESVQLLNYTPSAMKLSVMSARLEPYPSSVPIILGLENIDFETAVEFINFAKDTLQSLGIDRPVGTYGLVPPRQYWAPVNYRENPSNTLYSKSYRTWLADMQEAEDMICDHVDFLCPSIYTLYTISSMTDKNVERWKIYAVENIAMAKSCGKPVYPYLCINFAPNGILLPSWLVDLEIKTVKSMGVDGLIWFAADAMSYDWTKTEKIREWYDTTIANL